jgi:hypothetical protein
MEPLVSVSCLRFSFITKLNEIKVNFQSFCILTLIHCFRRMNLVRTEEPLVIFCLSSHITLRNVRNVGIHYLSNYVLVCTEEGGSGRMLFKRIF